MTEHGRSIYNKLVVQYEANKDKSVSELPSYIELNTRLAYKLPIRFNYDKWKEGSSENKNEWEVLRRQINETGMSKIVLMRPYGSKDDSEKIEYFKVCHVYRDNKYKTMLTVGIIDTADLRDEAIRRQEAFLLGEGALKEGEHLSPQQVLISKNIEGNISAEDVASLYYSHSCYFPQSLDTYVTAEQLKEIAAWHNVGEELIAVKQTGHDKKQPNIERE